jgi:Tetracyclin repressor-like, C-terminal domain
MLDALDAEVEVPGPSGDWRADLQRLGYLRRATLHRHLWAMEFMEGRPPLGPNTLLNLEHSLAIFDGMDLDVAASMRILETVLTYVLGAVEPPSPTRLPPARAAGFSWSMATPARRRWPFMKPGSE